MATYTSIHTGANIDKAVTNANRLLLSGSGDPTTSTVGAIGQIYINTTSGALFRCTAAVGGVYTWISATSAAAVSVSDPSNYFPETDAEGVLKNLGARAHFPATNLVTNGDFSQGTTGWIAGNSTISVSGGILTNTGDGTARNPALKQTIITPIVIGNKYYVKANLKVTNSVCSSIACQIGNAYNINTIQNPTQNIEYGVSIILTAVAVNQSIIFMHYYADNATANGKIMEAKYAFAINLTTTFGAGNEPTVSEMDAIMSLYPNSWFDGTVNPLLTPKQMLDLIRAKANRNWTKTLSLTLVNGWTGTLTYRKNDFNQIHITGQVVAGTGTVDSDISSALPVGFRPPVTTQAIGYNLSSGAFNNIRVLSSGAVRLGSSITVGQTLVVNSIIQCV